MCPATKKVVIYLTEQDYQDITTTRDLIDINMSLSEYGTRALLQYGEIRRAFHNKPNSLFYEVWKR